MSRARWLCVGAAVAFAAVLAIVPHPFGLESGPGFPSPSGRPLSETVFAALWWVAAVNLGLAALGFLTAGLWARPLPDLPDQAARADASRRLSTLALTGVVLAGMLAVGLRMPLASQSLWWDEAWSIRRVISGQPTPVAGAPDELEVETPPWSRPLWDYRKPTNHVFYNVLARGCVDAWRLVTGASAEAFDELAFRAPALVSSALGVVGVGVLTARLGFPAVAPAAALLLAIHPWHIKHGAEGRAYGLVLALSALAGLALLRAGRRGGWAEWVGFGGSLALLLYAQPSAIYLVLCMGLAAAGMILTRDRPLPERGIELGRLVVAGIVAAMALAQVMAPNVAQSLHWTDVFQEEQRIGLGVIVDLWANIATGIPIYASAFAEPPSAWISFAPLAAERPGLGLVVMFVLPLIVGLGLARVGLRSPGGRALMLAMLGGIALALFVTWLRHMYYYHRFLIFGLVPFVIGVCVGVATLLERLPSSRRAGSGSGVWIRRGIAVLLLVAFQVALWPQTRILLTRPYSPMRDAAERLRELAGDPPSRVLRGGLGLGGEMPALYDPWLRSLQTPEAFFALVRQAEQEDRPLYITYAYLGHNQPRFPKALPMLRDPARFELIDEFRGIEPGFHYRVLRYRSEAGPCCEEAGASGSGPCCGPDEGGADRGDGFP